MPDSAKNLLFASTSCFLFFLDLSELCVKINICRYYEPPSDFLRVDQRRFYKTTFACRIASNLNNESFQPITQ